MSTRSKIVYLLLALVFVFASLAAGAFAGVQMAAIDADQSNTAFHLNGDLNGASATIAGHCDASPICGFGSG